MMQQKERLEKQLDFIREIDKEKEIFRQTYLADASRKENDAEHAWHMAIMTMLLSEYANEKIDVLKTVGMLLIHDIVEIDAGDTGSQICPHYGQCPANAPKRCVRRAFMA